jgi:hypothetical protein
MKIEALSNKIRERSQTIDGEPFNVVYLSAENTINVGNYTDLKPYSAQSGSETKVSFSAPNRTMVIFSNKVQNKFEDRSSFEKYGGLIYIFEPLSEDILAGILANI